MKQTLSLSKACDIWIDSQCLNKQTPFGRGVKAVTKAIQHLGYVQIDTIHVIERCHHHILFNRIPGYRRQDLQKAQSTDKTVFEYWTHALSYIPTNDYRYFAGDMKEFASNPSSWWSGIKPEDKVKVLRLLKDGPVSIRDITDDVLVEKAHDWASKKPSKKALQFGFYSGQFVVSERLGMLKKYDLASRHFGWRQKPKAANEGEKLEYLIDRSLRSQGLISLNSVCHLKPSLKKAIILRLEKKVKSGDLVEIQIGPGGKIPHWIKPEVLEDKKIGASELTHILSPFDPLIIQRKRLKQFFGYDHLFEAYIPKEKRKFGYFSLPVLRGREIIALLDLKTDRSAGELLIQSWHWLGKNKSRENKVLIENELERFERFQLASE